MGNVSFHPRFLISCRGDNSTTTDINNAGGLVGGLDGTAKTVVGDVNSAVATLGSQVSSAVDGASSISNTISSQATSSLPTGTSTSASTSATSSTTSSSSFISSSSLTSSSSESSTILATSTSIAPLTTVAAKGFLDNKPLAGVVFAGIGVVVLVLLFIITTWALRRRRRKNLIEDAISFDPSNPHFEDGLAEKGRGSLGSDGLHRSLSNVSHGTYNQPPAAHAGFYDRQPYPRYPSPSEQSNAAYGGVAYPAFNPNAQRDAALAFQRPQMIATQLPATFGDGRRSPEDLMRGPMLKVRS
ncbi:hypothetical protein C8J56DRAFT_934973, partial [Mycena floridula]